MQQLHYTSNTIAELELAQKDLQTAAASAETFDAWLGNCPLTFYDMKDKAKKFPKGVEQVRSEFGQQLGRRPTAQDMSQLLQFYIDSKNDFKNEAIKKAKLKWTKGAKYTKDYLEANTKEVELRDELLRKNTKDTNLFQNFKLCGEQLVLIDGSECELLKEDTIGRISIDNSLWASNKIAGRVDRYFTEKVRMYYNKFSEFLATLDVKDLDIDVDNEVIETPIEDFIQTELPSVFIHYYKVRAVYVSWKDEDGHVHKQLDHFELKRNPKIESFNDIFRWTLDNWKLFKHCIQAQDKFQAWSNDASETAVSHWDPEEVHDMPEPWKEFINEKMPDIHFQMRLITFLGMCVDAKNSTQQYLIISDQGGSGKGVMMRALEHALPKNSISYLDSSMLADNNEFGLAGIKVWNTHISVMEEYSDGNMQSNKAKKLIANNPMDLNVKGKQFVHWEPINHKTIVFSNKKATIKEFSNRRRAIPLTFVGKYEWSEEKTDALAATAKDFLNFCYTTYKQCPMLVNNTYLVLSKEDETDYLKNGKANFKDEDTMSKRAFNEESLRDFFNTDEYTDSDDYIDFENAFEDWFMADDSAEISTHEVIGIVANKLANDDYDEYRDAFDVHQSKDSWILSTRSKAWWKWCEFLKSKGFTNKTVRKNGRSEKMWFGFSRKEFG